MILGYQSSVHGTVINLGSGTAVTVKELADLVSLQQIHINARKHDLKGTLSNTCRAKKLLHFSTRKNFTETILGLIELGKLGKDDFSASFWKHSDVIFKLSSAFPNWQQLDLATKN